MLRRCWLAFLVGLQMFTVAGCWDYRDVNKISFPATGAYDLHKDSERLPQGQQRVDLTVIIPNLAQDVKKPFRIERTTGTLIGNARGQKPYSSPGIYSAGVAAVIVFGEDLARGGLSNMVEALFRGAQIPKTENFAVAEGRGEDILRAPIKDYSNIGEYLKGVLKQSEKRGFIPSTTMYQFGVNRTSPGKNPIMPLLTLRNEKVEVSGTAIFKKDNMIGKANLDETRSLTMLRGIKASGNIPYIIKQDGQIVDKGSVDVSSCGGRKVKVNRNGDQFSFLITICLEGNLVEHQFNNNFTQNPDLRKMIENQIASDVKSDCTKFIEKMQQEYKVDCIDISKYILAKWRKEFKNQVDQEGFIENVEIKVKVKMKLKNVGELT
ncbi:MAG: Ger(x)C family spore germination protein [Syntrophomonas sp.]